MDADGMEDGMVTAPGPALTHAQAAMAIVRDPDAFADLKDENRPTGLTVDGATVTPAGEQPAEPEFVMSEGSPAAIEGWATGVRAHAPPVQAPTHSASQP